MRRGASRIRWAATFAATVALVLGSVLPAAAADAEPDPTTSPTATAEATPIPTPAPEPTPEPDASTPAPEPSTPAPEPSTPSPEPTEPAPSPAPSPGPLPSAPAVDESDAPRSSTPPAQRSLLTPFLLPGATPTASLTIQKAASTSTVTPGQTFTYTIQFQCTAGTVNGCVNAVMIDPLPPYLTITGAVTVSGTANFDTSGTTGTAIDVVLTDSLGGGQIGLAPGKVVTVTVPVTVDSPIPPEESGEPLVNTATIDADNAVAREGQAVVVLDVPEEIAAGTTKTIEPSGGFPAAGTPLEVGLTGTNASNVPVEQLVISDPVLDEDGNPPANDFFTYLGFEGTGEIIPPAGADTVQVRVYVDGAWMDGLVTPVAPPAPVDVAGLLPGVDPADVTGIQIVFSDTDGAGIAPGAEADVSLDFAQRDIVEELVDPILLTNDADTTVTTDDGATATSEPATDDYRIPPSAIQVIPGKTFSPDTVHAGDPSTVTLTGQNDSELPLDSLTIVEPASGTDNHFEDGAWEFTSMGSPAGSGVIWPAGAESATVTYSCDGSPGEPQTTEDVGTLPAPPEDCTPVTGFTVVFEGSIDPGATATIPFVITTNEDQDVEELSNSNTVEVIGEIDGNTGSDSATDTIVTIADRIAVEAGKRLIPPVIPAFPGQNVTVDLTARLLPFPDSTVDAEQIIVQDPADFATDEWYDSFDPRAVTATPVPGCSTMTVQYTPDDGATWIDIDGMVDIAGPTIFNGVIPADVGASATGIRFVYTAAPADGTCTGGFPPGTSVSPNLSFGLEPDAAGSPDPVIITDCGAAAATSPTTPDAESEPACDDITLLPVDPGALDPIDKAWDVDILNSRSQAEAGATLSWSTNGFSGVGRVDITDTQDPDTTGLPDSVFDAFDLVRIDAITPALDPYLTYDQITQVQLYRLPAGSTDPATGSWVDAVNDPCPAACDGVFSGVTLTADERATAIGFRLTYIESPTRADRIDGPTAPPVGSGVSASTGNDRHVHPVFQLRDDLRSNPDVPITEDVIYNTDDPGVIFNSVRGTGYANPADTVPLLTATDGDIITLIDVPVTVIGTKTWTGGPLGIPEEGVPQDRYPLSQISLTATNTTPAKIDTLTISEPNLDDVGPESCTTNPFDSFNLVGFTTISTPASIGAADVTITLTPGPDGQTEYTRDEALALTEADLVDVTGFTVEYTGRVNIGATATVGFDLRLREANRVDDSAPVEGETVCDQVRVDAADLVGYPGVDPNTATDHAQAEISLVQQGLAVTAGKEISPESIIEPSTGPAQVTISGQPTGPSRTVEMVLTDDSATFFNQYDFVGFQPLVWVTPIDEVRVDAYTDGTWSVDAGGAPVVTGGDWVPGDEIQAPDTTLTLPDGVTAAQVQGLRFTFTRVDGANWENPADPTQTVTFSVERRAELNTGGPVLPDLAQNPPAPGEIAPGIATNDVTADVVSSDVDIDGNPLTATGDATAELRYQHANNAVQVRKSPDGDVKSPGVPFAYTLTVTNTGAVDIVDPVITDRFPTDAGGPQIELAPEPGYTYAIAGGEGMPTDAADVTVAESPTQLVFEFPAGSTLPVGATYTITFLVETRAGLLAGTQFTNSVGVVADRPWDQCDDNAGNQVDPGTGECRTTATNTVLSAGAVRVIKGVRAEGSDELGVVLDPLAVTEPTCTPQADGFYIRPCVPIAEPGGAVDWRLHFQNSGNLPLDRILGIDRLPEPGDGLATAPDLERGSQWRPLLAGPRPALVDGQGGLRVYYTTATSGWCDGPQGSDGALLCPALGWTEWPEGESVPVDPATVTGLQFEYLPATPLAPAATFDIDIAMTAPPYSPADTPNTEAASATDTYAFNTIGTTARFINDNGTGYTLTTEPPRVGVGLAHGGLRVVKETDGDAAAQYAPDSFAVTLSCVSAGVVVPLPDDIASLTLTADTPVTIYDLPFHATCTLAEGDNGQTSAVSTSATVQREVADFETATLVNVYEYASLSVTKDVASEAVDQDDTPIAYGPFTVEVDCTFLNEAVYADGYGPDAPMVAVLEDDDVETFTGLPAGAACTITETDDKGAVATTIETTVGAGDPATSEGTVTGPIALAPDSQGGNSAVVTNVFEIGSVDILKVVTGDVAGVYGDGPFVVRMVCVLNDETGIRITWDDTITLGGDAPLSASVTGIAAGSECRFTEPDDGGASVVTIDPDGPVLVDAGEPVTVTVTNEFNPATLYVDKLVDGDAAAFAPDTFPIEVTCSADGEVLPGFPITVDVTPGTPAEVDTLAGAECSAIETDSGQATEVTYDPPREDGEGSDTVVVTDDPEDPATITVTNTYRPGALQIVKRVVGTGTAGASGPFVFSIVCAFNGNAEAYVDEVTLTRGPSTTMTSDVIEPLPIGAECTVTETDDGGADRTPAPVTVTIPDPQDGPAAVAVAEFVNTFTAPLPPTGGDAPAWWIVAAGTAGIAIGAALLLVRTRSRREE